MPLFPGGLSRSLPLDAKTPAFPPDVTRQIGLKRSGLKRSGLARPASAMSYAPAPAREERDRQLVVLDGSGNNLHVRSQQRADSIHKTGAELITRLTGVHQVR